MHKQGNTNKEEDVYRPSSVWKVYTVWAAAGQGGAESELELIPFPSTVVQ